MVAISDKARLPGFGANTPIMCRCTGNVAKVADGLVKFSRKGYVAISDGGGMFPATVYKQTRDDRATSGKK
jgi:hypothetical protein